jgi:hypothetical protein
VEQAVLQAAVSILAEAGYSSLRHHRRHSVPWRSWCRATARVSGSAPLSSRTAMPE